MNTTPASHSIGARFVFLGTPALIPADISLLNQTFNLRAPAYGTLPSAATPQSVTFTGRSQTEWSPVDLVATKPASDWILTWIPRHRLGNSSTPIASQYFTGYRVSITYSGTTVTRDTTTATLTYTSAEQTADFGGALTTFDVEISALNQFTGPGDALSETV